MGVETIFEVLKDEIWFIRRLDRTCYNFQSGINSWIKLTPNHPFQKRTAALK